MRSLREAALALLWAAWVPLCARLRTLYVATLQALTLARCAHLTHSLVGLAVAVAAQDWIRAALAAGAVLFQVALLALDIRKALTRERPRTSYVFVVVIIRTNVMLVYG
jgi:hypothetical protein